MSSEAQAWRLVNSASNLVSDDSKELNELAITKCNEAIKLYQSCAEAYFWKGVAYQKLGQHEKAIKEYNNAIDLGSERAAAAHRCKGDALLELGRYSTAIVEYDRSITLEDDYGSTRAMTHGHKGHALIKMGKSHEALEEFEKAIQLCPLDLEGYSAVKTRILCNMGRYEEAIAEYDRKIMKGSTMPGLYVNKGEALRKLGLYKKALECYEQAIKKDPTYVIAYCCKGEIFVELGKDIEALKVFNQAKVIVESGEKSIFLSEEDIDYAKKILDSDGMKLLKKLTQLLSIEPLPGGGNRDKDLVYQEFRETRKEIIRETVDTIADTIEPSSSIERKSNRDSIMVKMQNLEDTFNARLKALEVSKADRSEMLELDTRKADRSEVSSAIKTNSSSELKSKQMAAIASDRRLQDYFDAFVSTFSSSFSGAQVIRDGKLVLDTGDIRVSIAANLVSLIPFAGGIAGRGIEAIGHFIKEGGLKRAANKLLEIARDHKMLSEITEAVAREIVLSREKQDELLTKKAEANAKSWVSTLVDKGKEFGVEINTKMYGDSFKTPSAKLGNQDATALIDKWVSRKIKLRDHEKSNVESITRALVLSLDDQMDTGAPPIPSKKTSSTSSLGDSNLQKLLDKHSLTVTKGPKVGEKFIQGFTRSTEKDLVTEELKDLGYIVIDRCKGLSQMKIFVETVYDPMPASAAAAKSSNCVVMRVDKAIYNNPLLNNEHLVSEFMKKYGISALSRVIDITSELIIDNRESVQEICSSKDAIIYLAMLSGEFVDLYE